MSRPFWVRCALLVLALLLFPASAKAAVGLERSGEPAVTTAGTGTAPRAFDVRSRQQPSSWVPSGPRAARDRVRFIQHLGRQGVVQTDPVTGTPRMIGRLDGFLTGPSTRDAADIALDYVRTTAPRYGPAIDTSALHLIRSYRDVAGTAHLVWEQRYHGIRVFDRDLHANVAKDGRLINVSGGALPGLSLRTTTPVLGSTRAVGVALRDGGSRAPVRRTAASQGPDRRAQFAGGHRAELVLFPVRPGAIRLGWDVKANLSSSAVMDYVIDAVDGSVLARRNTVRSYQGTVHAWRYVPGAESLPYRSTPLHGGFAEYQTVSVDSFSALEGPYAHVYTDVDDDNVPDTPSVDCPECGEIPANAVGLFHWWDTFEPVPDTIWNFCDVLNCSWDGWAPSWSWRRNLRQNADQVMYFLETFHNWLRDEVGFTPQSGNFEGDDGVQAQVFDGAATDSANPGTPDDHHINNANMLEVPDGVPPVMQMFLWYGLPNLKPDTNGGDDAAIVYHEYTHGLSARLVTGSGGAPALGTSQSNAMGEGWSDWFAMDYLEANGLDEQDTAQYQGQMLPGVYSNGGFNIRANGLDCPVTGAPAPECPGTQGAGPGGFTFGDMGKILDSGFESHADGEIWSETLWDIRQAMGAPDARSIIADGMRLSPADPSMLDMRNAILQADVTDFAGAHLDALWAVFAGRGLGFFASAFDGNDTTPAEDFSLPPAPGSGTALRGRVTDRDAHTPAKDAIVEIVGHSSGFPGDYVAITNANGEYTIPDVPAGTYPDMRASAPGFDGDRKQNVAVGPGRVVDWALRRDYASFEGGARVASASLPDFTAQGCGPTGLIDETDSGWGSTSPNDQEYPGAKAIVVQLPVAVDIAAIGIDPGATCGDGASASTGAYRVETSPDGASWTQAVAGTFTAADNHRTTELNPAGGKNGVRFVRYTMLAPQRQTGAIDTDGGVSGLKFMDSTELEVFGTPAAPATQPAPTAAPASQAAKLSLTGLRLEPSRFRAVAHPKRGASTARRRPRGTTVRYRLSTRATVAFIVSRRGRRGAVPVPGSFIHQGSAGANRLRFTGWLRRKRLRAGRYRLTATPRVGQRAARPVSVDFRIIR